MVNYPICYHEFMFLKDILFPKFCLGCGFLGSYICLHCQNELSYIQKDSCLYCNRISLYGLTHPLCSRKDGIDGIISILHYNNLLKKIIKTIKYRGALDAWIELCQVIQPDMLKKLSYYKALQRLFCLQIIPLHPKKNRERGFNQAQLIALFFQKFLLFPLENFLLRKKNTLSQAQITKRQYRYFNVRDAFAIPTHKDLRGKHIIIVDDVVTSGSTVKEAALTLKKAGATSVFVLTLARG